MVLRQCQGQAVKSALSKAIIPKVTMKFWNGAERTVFDYVQRGGQLYIIGGQALSAAATSDILGSVDARNCQK